MTKRHAKLIRAMRENAERDPVRKVSKNDDDLDLEELQDGNDDLVELFCFKLWLLYDVTLFKKKLGSATI